MFDIFGVASSERLDQVQQAVRDSVNIIGFLSLSFFSLLNSFFLHDIGRMEAVAFSVISIFSAAVIFLYKGNASTLLKVFFIFIYIFFGTVPVVELDYGRIYWGGGKFESGDYLLAAIVVTVLNCVVFISYVFFNKKVLVYGRDNLPAQDWIPNKIGKLALVLISLICLGFVLSFNNYNIYSLAFRGGELVDRSQFESGGANLVYSAVIRFIPISSAIIVLYKVRGSLFLKSFLLITGVVCAFPSGLARLQVPTYYFPLLFYFFPSMLKGNRLVCLLIFGFLFVFPFLDNFRRYSDGAEMVFSVDYEFLLGGHLDAFQNFARIISVGFVSYGVQLLGVLLFFVPRSVWESKPVGTGYQLAENANYSFNNISATWYAEGWANFGFLGAMMFALAIGYLMAKLDKLFWHGRANEFAKMFYLFFLGYMFFLLRGDLLSAFSYLVGTVLAVLVPYAVMRGSSMAK